MEELGSTSNDLCEWLLAHPITQDVLYLLAGILTESIDLHI